MERSRLIHSPCMYIKMVPYDPFFPFDSVWPSPPQEDVYSYGDLTKRAKNKDSLRIPV